MRRKIKSTQIYYRTTRTLSFGATFGGEFYLLLDHFTGFGVTFGGTKVPQSATVQSRTGTSFTVSDEAMDNTVSKPLTMRPSATYFPSKLGKGFRVKKN